MKVTGIRPMVIAKNTSSITDLFNDLGFKLAHEKTDIQGHDNYKNDVLKNADGEAIYLTQVPDLPADICTISINVDNLDEACKILEKHGFKNVNGKIQLTGTSKATSYVSPNGLMIALCEHLK